MVTSIVLTGMYNIGISSQNKLKTPDGVVIDIKDVPFVRYRFEHYGDAELEYIKNNIEKFPCAHLIEINLDEKTFNLLDKIEDMELRIAKYVYIDVDTDEVVAGLSDNKIDLLDQLMDHTFDAINIKDVSLSIYPLALSNLKKQIKDVTGLKEREIGVCGGPCCFFDGNACLTAVKARELQAIYTLDADTAVVPSANHEGSLDNTDNLELCTNKCGCIRYHVYNHDVDAPVHREMGIKKEKTKVVKVDKEVEVDSKDKKAKQPKQKAYTRIMW